MFSQNQALQQIIAARDVIATGSGRVLDNEFASLARRYTTVETDLLLSSSRFRDDIAMMFVCGSIEFRDGPALTTEDGLGRFRLWVNQGNSLGYHRFTSSVVAQIWPRLVALINNSVGVTLDSVVGLFKAYGKALRLSGEYNSAADVYRIALRRAKSVGDPYLQATLILALGKTAHTNLWRAGYFACLTTFAERRFRDSLRLGSASRPTVFRNIGICIDSKAMLDYELSSLIGGEWSEAALQSHLQRRWQRALWYARESESQNSIARILCRSSYARFRMPRADARCRTRAAAIKRFKLGMDILADTPDDARGLGVRYGQYAEMLAESGHFREAEVYLENALTMAFSIQDWRTLAANHLRRARFKELRGQTLHSSIDDINLALTYLKRLKEQLPELEIRLLRERARYCWLTNSFEEGEQSLVNIQKILSDLEVRLVSDITSSEGKFDTTNPLSSQDNKESYIPKSVLTRGEEATLKTALFTDFRLYARSAQHLLDDQNSAREFVGRRVTTLRQTEFYYDLFRGYAHRIKGRLEHRIGAVQAKVFEIASSMPMLLDSTKVDDILSPLVEEQAALDHEFVSLLCGVEGLPVGRAISTSVGALLRTYIGETATPVKALATLFSAVTLDLEVSSDFTIHCHPEVLSLVLGNLLSNSAREAAALADGERAVFVQVSWVDEPKQCGEILICDTGGKVEKLQSALQAGWSGGTYGLPHALAFFASFLGTISANTLFGKSHGDRQLWTCLKIEIPVSGRVQHS